MLKAVDASIILINFVWMSYKIIMGAGLLLLCLVSGAQSSYGVRKVNAFFSEHLPGIIPVDNDGNSSYHGPDTIHTIYIETNGAFIKWTGAWKDGKSFSVNTVAITDIPFEAGINKIDNKKVLLKPAAGNKLWLLELQQKEHSSKPPVKIRPGEIILQGKTGRQTIIQRISSQTELASIPSV